MFRIYYFYLYTFLISFYLSFLPSFLASSFVTEVNLGDPQDNQKLNNRIIQDKLLRYQFEMQQKQYLHTNK